MRELRGRDWSVRPPHPVQILAAAGELAGKGGMAISAASIDGQWSVVAASSEALGGANVLVVDSEKGLVQVLPRAATRGSLVTATVDSHNFRHPQLLTAVWDSSQQRVPQLLIMPVRV